MPSEARAEWWVVAHGSDAALMLALIHEIVVNGDADPAFLEHYCEGWPQFEAYVLGNADGQAKTPRWTAEICRIPEDEIASLARELAGKRVLVTVSHSLQRAEHGEQPVWLALAAVLGQQGLPGGGYAYALGATVNIITWSPSRRFLRALIRLRLLFRWPGLRTCCFIQVKAMTLTVSGCSIRISNWYGGPAATRSITIRISAGCVAPSASWIR
ncbi:hypothetical protein [Raoultella sp. 10-1]|uniref:hypothetical protein n=1 Tax=Raoultella sp. 10-1 TaxID=2683201 RepID=UPI00351B6F3F